MTANEIRRSFLHYFETLDHRIVPSAPLVPHDDPTLLFNNAGMNQFKDVFLGRDRRAFHRAVTAQKCMRVSGKHNDLDNVGPSLTHHTFFEMLGNFSFGDYFKADAIPFAWALLTREWGIPADRLYATVFCGDKSVPQDEEALAIWLTFLPDERIGRLGAADNFWQMGDTGPCGRCSEIYYLRGPEIPCPEEAAGRACRRFECSCDRFVEVWNNVFMEFDRQPDGSLVPLPAPSIDTGMGLERIAAILQGHLSNYDTDLFTPVLGAIADRAHASYGGTMTDDDVSMRVVADHLRAMTFLIGDGVVPSNEWRGYVLRKIMRRAMRHGKRLGLTEPFLHTLVPTLVREFGNAYPELRSGEQVIVDVVRFEELRFDSVLSAGLPRLEEVLDQAAAASGVVDGEMAFRLYDTFGLPREFIEDMIDERRLTLDSVRFEQALQHQRTQARAGSKFKTSTTAPGAETLFTGLPATSFVGYDEVRVATHALGLARIGKAGEEPSPVSSLRAGDAGWIVLAETPFYVESGGQVSDSGMLHNAGGFAATVEDVASFGDGVRAHRVIVNAGTVTAGESITAELDIVRRTSIRRNHTATHLLHAALRQVLGPHVKQAGSLVAPDRLRFDFVHFHPVTRDQLLEIERLVNEQVLRNIPVNTEITSIDEAMAAGAMALFGEKYGDRVRVVEVPGYSLELCGGTHAPATGAIGPFAAVSESGVAAGTRRLEAITGDETLRVFRETRDELLGVASALHARPGTLADRIAALQEEHRHLTREVQELRVKAAMGEGDTGADPLQSVGGVSLVTRHVHNVDKAAMRTLVDQHRSRIGSGVVLLAASDGNKVAMVVGVTHDLTAKAPAGDIVKALAPHIGGRGGGRPDFAEAGGKDPAGIAPMFEAARAVVEQLLCR